MHRQFTSSAQRTHELNTSNRPAIKKQDWPLHATGGVFSLSRRSFGESDRCFVILQLAGPFALVCGLRGARSVSPPADPTSVGLLVGFVKV